ncbi:MAG: GWxTD domain-containing protein [Cyclobacteriaceae bacterium]|nr:GWxTD domain-containing protein [Cyclobacteriaceae bacterium]
MKIQNKLQIIVCLLAFLYHSPGFGQKVFIDENTSYWYSIASELHIAHRTTIKKDSATIFFEITFNAATGFGDYHYISELHGSYHTLNMLSADTLAIDAHMVSIKSKRIYVQLNVPHNDKTDIAVLRLVNKKSGKSYVYDVPLIEDYNFTNDGLMLYAEDGVTPVVGSFTNQGKQIVVRDDAGYQGPLFGFYYGHSFEEAVPPMIIDGRPTTRKLEIDSTFMVSANEPIALNKIGLYFFQKDSSSANGVALRVQDAYFPLVKTTEKVLEPLIYISTRTETDKIRNAENPRQAFEQYWLDLMKIPSLATSTVSDFYTRVEGANYLFTNFKEGWKSDMGMIYIVYGPPSEVYKSEEIIDWVYTGDLRMPTVRFSFYKVKNLFTDQHYSLLRKKTYDKNWFKSVELWREGKK